MEEAASPASHSRVQSEDLSQPVPSSTECGYYDVLEVSRIADALLLALATACVEKTAGDFFKQPLSVAAETRKEMLDYLNAQCEAVANGGSALGVVTIDVPFRVVEDMLESFVRSKRTIFNRVSSGIRYAGEKKDDRIEEVVNQIDKEGVWMFGRREGVAKAVLKRIDRSKMNHCPMKFADEEGLVEHKKKCMFRPINCANEGCTQVFSALHAEEHDGTCVLKLLPCEQKCEALVTRGEMDKHCVTVCPMKPVPCPFEQAGCIVPLLQGQVDHHCREFVQQHLLYTYTAVHTKHDSLIANLATRLALVEKAVSIAQRSEAVDVGTLTLKSKESETKMSNLDRELGKLRSEMKNLNVVKEVQQLRRELMELKKSLAKPSAPS